MLENTIETYITDILNGETQTNSLDFVAYLKANNMAFEKAKGYWENQHYWLVRYNDEYVCFILLDGKGTEAKFSPITVWSDDSGSNFYEHFPLADDKKEIAWKNVDICGNCGSCSGGTKKIIFGKSFDNVCLTTFRFVNPDTKTFEVMKTIMHMRKSEII